MLTAHPANVLPFASPNVITPLCARWCVELTFQRGQSPTLLRHDKTDALLLYWINIAPSRNSRPGCKCCLGEPVRAPGVPKVPILVLEGGFHDGEIAAARVTSERRTWARWRYVIWWISRDLASVSRATINIKLPLVIYMRKVPATIITEPRACGEYLSRRIGMFYMQAASRTSDVVFLLQVSICGPTVAG